MNEFHSSSIIEFIIDQINFGLTSFPINSFKSFQEYNSESSPNLRETQEISVQILAPKSEFNWNYSDSQVSEGFCNFIRTENEIKQVIGCPGNQIAKYHVNNSFMKCRAGSKQGWMMKIYCSRKSEFEPAKLNDLSVVRFLRFQFWNFIVVQLLDLSLIKSILDSEVSEEFANSNIRTEGETNIVIGCPGNEIAKYDK
ncbi:unnamed protein product [Caenorhabditis angaria]|uniref:Uncharacterized protein n=1 Tax=Caenorhabditis angaria TaxID=860376 RepID=A0A9P1IZE8_9PELO|nr:unnamed protein product [Caenorhabditis angaria]